MDLQTSTLHALAFAKVAGFESTPRTRQVSITPADIKAALPSLALPANERELAETPLEIAIRREFGAAAVSSIALDARDGVTVVRTDGTVWRAEGTPYFNEGFDLLADAPQPERLSAWVEDWTWRMDPIYASENPEYFLFTLTLTCR